MKKNAQIRRPSLLGKIVALALAVLLLIGGSVWGVRETIQSRRAAANLAEVRQLREQFKSETFKEMTPEERRQLGKDYWEKFKKLPFQERKRMFAERARDEQSRYDEYFSSPEDQRAAVLARQMEDMRKRRGSGPSGGGRGGAAAQATNSAKGTSTPASTPPPNDNANLSREVMRREFLDMTTPDQRAQRSVYRQAMRQQMQSQGGTR